MKIWYVLRWACLALLAELRKLCDMILHTTFYLTAEPERLWISVNPETVSLDANNIQSTPLDIRIWTGEGSNKSEYKAYVTLRVESVVNEYATVLYEESPESKIFAWGYTIPEDKYPTANRISINAYDDEARTKEIAAKQVNIVAANPTPFPRPEEWAASLVYKNGEYLIFGDMVYMWCSRVPGNTDVDPKTWIKNNPTSGLWKSYTEYAVLATKVFMAKFGLLGQAVFKDEYLMSQQGVDANGNDTWDYRKYGTKDFTPNLLINFLVGLFKGNKLEVDGGVFKNIRSPNNSFRILENGDIQIVGRIETSFDGKRVVIDPESNSIKMYNQSEQEVMILSFMDTEWNGVVTSIPRLRMQRVSSSGIVTDLTDVSPGSIEIKAKGIDVSYDMTINPLVGITFFRDGVVTKTYPKS